MRRVTPSLARIIAASLVCATASAAELTPDELNTALTSVSKRERYAFASIPSGLYRAPMDTKRWERLKTPPEMPLNCKFASEPGLTSLILYVARPPSRRPNGPPADPNLRYGLYLSRDDGVTWELASARDDFGDVLLHPDGSVYATTGARPGNDGFRIGRSKDLGKTWTDITGKASGPIEHIDVDPDRPNLIRMRTWCIRAYTVTADDEKYDWLTLPDSIYRERRRGRDFFRRSPRSANRYHNYVATLANYFDHDFGDATSVFGMEAVPAQPRFEFARGQRVVIPVRVVLHHNPDLIWIGRSGLVTKPAPPVERLADRPGDLHYWQCSIETAGRRVVRLPESRARVKIKDYPPLSESRNFDLTPTSPYQRDVDLSILFDFADPGEYRVQITYDSNESTRTDDSLWRGALSTTVFTVVVR